MEERTVIRIRKGINGFPYSACTSDGYFITNAESIEQIREHYDFELKHKMVRIIKETSLYPEGYTPENVVYGYARVSTKGQARDGNSLEAQEKALKAAGAEIIVKEAYTGSTTSRPEFEKLLKQLKGGDTLIVTKLDRIARSTVQGAELVRELLDRRVKVNILNMGMIDNSATGKLISDVFFAFAEFERAMIVERTQEGKALARKDPNFKEGRPRIEKARLDHAMELLEHESYKQVAEKLKISKSTLVREKARRKKEGQ